MQASKTELEAAVRRQAWRLWREDNNSNLSDCSLLLTSNTSQRQWVPVLADFHPVSDRCSFPGVLSSVTRKRTCIGDNSKPKHIHVTSHTCHSHIGQPRPLRCSCSAYRVPSIVCCLYSPISFLTGSSFCVGTSPN